MTLETKYTKTTDGKTVRADELSRIKAAPGEAETVGTLCDTGSEDPAEGKPEKMSKMKGDEHGKRV